MSEEREMTPMEEAVRHTAEKIEAEEIAEIEADPAHVDLGCDCETCDPEGHAAEHPEDHINGSYAAELEECCGGHCGCHDPVIVDGDNGKVISEAEVAERFRPGDIEAPPIPSVTYDEKGRRRTTPLHKVESSLNIGRNDPCPCGSGKKFKKCCIDLINNE